MTVPPLQRNEKPRTATGNYAQDWPSYNLATINEKPLFPQVLHLICSHVQEPVLSGPGRPKASYKEQAFCVTLKQFETDASRRFIGDLMIAKERNLLEHVPHFNSVSNYGRDALLVDILKQLVVRSSFPLRNREKGIAIDSTSFSTDEYIQWCKV